MAKVISTLVSIILLVVANQAAVHFKRMGMLPEGKEAQQEYHNGSDRVYMAANRQPPIPVVNGKKTNNIIIRKRKII